MMKRVRIADLNENKLECLLDGEGNLQLTVVKSKESYENARSVVLNHEQLSELVANLNDLKTQMAGSAEKLSARDISTEPVKEGIHFFAGLKNVLRLKKERHHKVAEDENMLTKFMQHLNGGKSFEELDEETRNWWMSRYNI